MGRRSELLRKLRHVRPYDARRWRLYDPETSQVITNRLSTIDPEVWGRYDLASQKVVPADPDDPGVWGLHLDLLAPEVSKIEPALERERYDLVLPHLGPGTGICLDACTQDPRAEVRRRVEALGYEYVPVDIEQRRGVRREDLTALSYADGEISRIISLDTLEHIEDYAGALREMRRVLAPGGYAVVHVPVYYFDKPASEPISPGTDPWEHVRYFSARELAATMIDSGLVLARLALHLDYGAAIAIGVKP